MVVRGSRATHGQFGEKIHVCGKSWRRGRGKIFRPSFDLRHMIFQPPSPLVDQKKGRWTITGREHVTGMDDGYHLPVVSHHRLDVLEEFAAVEVLSLPIKFGQ